jgi:hypothetical protein
MQVLEMEEVESLVNNAARKRLGDQNKRINANKNSNNNKAGSSCASCFMKGDFMSKVVVLACVILLGLLYLSAKEDDQPTLNGDIESKTPMPTPTPIPTVADLTPVTDPPELPKETPSPTAKPTDPPTEPPKETPSPTVKQTEPPKETPAPTNPPESQQEEPAAEPPKEDDSDNGDEEDNDEREDNSPYGYSSYATIRPLVDHPLPDDDTKAELAEKFGRWRFWDGDEDERPQEDYCGKYPNRDIPGEDFPDDAWQGDAVFVNHYLNDADQLIARTMEAIFIEYGHGKPLPPEGTYSCLLENKINN